MQNCLFKMTDSRHKIDSLTLQICLLGPLIFRGVMELFNVRCSSLRKADRVGAQTGSDVNEREREVTCPRTSNGLQRV